MLRLLLLLATVILTALPAARPGEAAEAVTLSVRPGLDGMVKLGAWFPVEVQIANTGPDLTGEVQVQVDGIDNRGAFNRPPVVYSAPAVLPRQSNKRVVVEVLLPSPIDKLGARLVSNGQTIAQAEVPLDRVGQNELVCGVLSGNRTALDFLPGIDLVGRQQRRVRVAHLDVVDLPTSPQLLSSLDCLVLSNASLAGTTDVQREALRGWTAAGGLLVVAGGPGWQKTVAGLPPGLLPVEITGTLPLRSARALETYFGEPIEDPGPWLIADARVTDGAVVVAQDNHPLIVTARRGQGAVVFLAMDPAIEPLRSWRGATVLWRSLLGYTPSRVQLPSNFIRQYVGWGRPPRNAMSDLSALRPATASWLPAGLMLYALVVGPFTYLVLRRLGRLEWLLWVAPMLTALASLATFGAARNVSESDILFNKISLVRAWDLGADGYARTYVSAFSPRDGQYQIEMSGRNGPADGLILPLFNPFPAPTGTPTAGAASVKVQRDGSTVLSDYKLDARQLGTFSVDSRVPGGAELKSDLTLSGGTIAGTIANTSKGKLLNASLIVGTDVVRLGDIAPGETRQVVAPVPDGMPIGYVDLPAIVHQLYPNPTVATPVSSSEAMTRDILESALGSTFSFSTRLDVSPITLVGWPERAPIQLQVRNGRAAELDRTLLIAGLPLAAQPGEELRIPSSLIERRNLIAGAGRVSQGQIALGNGDALLFEYTLPQRPDHFQIESLALDVNSPGGNGQPLPDVAQLAVYDWPSADWRDVPIGNGAPTALGDPARVVSVLGQVRTRFVFRPPANASSAVLTLDRLDLAVRGRGL